MKTAINLSVRRMSFCALFTALIAVGAFLQIPVPFMDYFTLQFLFVLLAGMLLGSGGGSLSIAVYVALGLSGVPIFAAGGGIQYIFRPSFGYLLGFIGAAALTGWISHKASAVRFWKFFPAALAGLAFTYAVGFLYKYIILNHYLGQPTPLAVIFLSAFPLDLPGDLVLCVAASALAGRLRRVLEKEHLI